MLFVTVIMLLGAHGPAVAQSTAQGKLKVVASFTILADFVRNVGGDRIEVQALVPPNGDAHVFEPSPADSKRVADAALVVVNGLGFEGWLERLVAGADSKATIVVATKGIAPRLRAERGRIDPHAWQSVANAKIYVGNIRDALIAADPAGKSVYETNAAAYLAKLDALDAEVRDAIAKIPPDRRHVISSHDAFGYFQDAYAIAFTAPQGVSTEAEVSAKNIAAIIAQIRREKVPAVFLENVEDPRLLERIASETGAKIGGTLYTDALTDANGAAPTYIDMVRHNIKQIATGLTAGATQ
jgi:zinc/manganese transport system substrate-binding protein